MSRICRFRGNSWKPRFHELEHESKPQNPLPHLWTARQRSRQGTSKKKKRNEGPPLRGGDKSSMKNHRQCCITEAGTTQAQTPREYVSIGPSSRNKWMLRRSLVEVFRGDDSPKPPQRTRGAFMLARDGRRPDRDHAIQNISPNEKYAGS